MITAQRPTVPLLWPGRICQNETSKDPSQDNPYADPGTNTDPRHFQNGDFIALLRGARQASRAAADARREGREDLALSTHNLSAFHPSKDFKKENKVEAYRAFDPLLVPRIIVDVDGDGFQGRGLLCEGVEEGVVLPTEPHREKTCISGGWQ